MLVPFPRGGLIGLSHQFDGVRWHATELGRYHNHATSPTAENVLMRRNCRFLIALRDLSPGEEVTVDYRRQPEFEQPEGDWR